MLLSGVQQHDDEDEQHHDGAGVDDELRGGDEFAAELQIEQRRARPSRRPATVRSKSDASAARR